MTALAASSAAQAQVYYRVDLGYSKSTDADFKDKNNSEAGRAICGDADCNSAGSFKEVDNSLILGGGVGYRFNPNVRGDVTLGYRPGYKIDASDSGDPSTRFNADIKSWSLMANGYYDFPLGAWTPYVGAGLGYARNKVGTVSFDFSGFTGSLPGGTHTGLAWALMAGAGIPLSNRVTLDVGYRYIDLGKLDTGAGSVTVDGFGPVAPYSGAAGKLKAHELTVGVRF